MSRRHARETAMQYLYGLDMTEQPWDEIEPQIDEDELSARDKEYVKKIVNGVIEKKENIDTALAEFLKNWNIERIPKVDLAILRLGIYEINWCEEIPPGATINECVDIAKNFSTDKSGAFINGILANYKRSLEGKEEDKEK